MSFLLNIYIDLKELIYLLFYLGNTDWMSFRFLDFFEVVIWSEVDLRCTDICWTDLRCTDASDLNCTLFILLYIGAECLQSYYTVTIHKFTLYRCVRFTLYFIYLAVHWGRVFTVILHSHNTQIYVVQMDHRS